MTNVLLLSQIAGISLEPLGTAAMKNKKTTHSVSRWGNALLDGKNPKGLDNPQPRHLALGGRFTDCKGGGDCLEINMSLTYSRPLFERRVAGKRKLLEEIRATESSSLVP